MNYRQFEDILQCPECGGTLDNKQDTMVCNGNCNCAYPIYFNIPVLITPLNPVFNQSDFSTQAPPDIFFKEYKNPVIRFLKNIRPDVTLNIASKKNYTAIAKALEGKKNCAILVIGGSIDGMGILELKANLPKGTILVESDVAHGPNTNIIIDAHQIPFKDASFDLVIAQAVLEHVLDPFQCVSEINRVLKQGGMIYAETPFMQQVHGGKYDFHRFTHLGHRRLFRHFEEVKSGIVCGPGSSLAWALRYFMLSFAPNKKIDRIISYGSSFLVFWLKYFDYLISSTNGAYDAACGYYFWGQKQTGYTLPDNELLSQYRGYRS